VGPASPAPLSQARQRPAVHGHRPDARSRDLPRSEPTVSRARDPAINARLERPLMLVAVSADHHACARPAPR
jgi:hypothetical protein